VHTHIVARACIGIHSGVGDFRWGTGAENMGVGFISDVQLTGFGTFVRNPEPIHMVCSVKKIYIDNGTILIALRAIRSSGSSPVL
jgi:hypothetical protein